MRRVDLTRLMSSAARELVAAAQLAMERGDTDDDRLSELLLTGKLAAGTHVVVGVADGRLTVTPT